MASTTPRSKRWSRISTSANADKAYHQFLKDTPDAYTYICICTRPGFNPDDEYDSSDEDNNIPPPQSQCDGGETCICFKPLTSHPDHPWRFTKAGLETMITYRIMIDLRDPDAFGMYTFNDHAGFGALEVVQNAILDFRDAVAKGDWWGMWAVCEALGWIDDGGILDETNVLYEHMFIAMLAELEKQGQLGPNSDVRNLGFIMGMYASEATNTPSEYDDPDTQPGSGTYYGEIFVQYLAAYATRRNVTIHGPSDLDESIAKAEEVTDPEDVVFPTGNKDPWKWVAAMKAYEKRNKGVAFGASRKSNVGGDSLDITTFSSAERKRKSFTKTDPLTPDMIKSIKEGEVLQMS
ncbi:hypothetical protein BO78DRAFT_458957 [Aspergillus sclerotiicarbonarius CBS 121057]|uniref:Uncharacterized protein n=1 Tax=Aspergillus sclerotiicarbonarius (strain CBS 121057 / IBT 28362) TaxID=1448318 RepID=A0A319EHI2_ASPSB|nr:hypothetical protein BO78DRAFT_458957 [Aspergillus sclerotiicarbonarius CBS 121057]